MKIIGIDGMSGAEVHDEVERGAKFVIYKYCISVILMTFQRPSDIYFVRAGESRLARGLPFSFMTMFLGWWGIPWGPIYTIASFATNFGGGQDVTSEVLSGFIRGTGE